MGFKRSFMVVVLERTKEMQLFTLPTNLTMFIFSFIRCPEHCPMSVNSPKIKSSCSNRCVRTVLWHSADLYCMKDDSLQAESELKIMCTQVITSQRWTDMNRMQGMDTTYAFTRVDLPLQHCNPSPFERVRSHRSLKRIVSSY